MLEIDSYLEKVSSSQKEELGRIRKIVKKEVPEAVEQISYGMPGFKYKNKYLIGYGAFKNHMSIFPTSQPIEQLKEKLSAYEISKGTIQFTKDNLLSEALIIDLIKARLSQID